MSPHGEGHGEVRTDSCLQEYVVPFGEANVVREGGDVTIVTLGRMVHTSLEAAGQLAAAGGGACAA